ncbi:MULTISPECIES: DUF4946 domain-containing protein [Pseudomonas]|jgi:hypothetical protein|nr:MULTISPECIES: DUF4946 domain-containing protein [Pseudomonas]PMU11150.1 DUF4946 domain-containing protein [Pseudomonas sp. FW305-20]PMU21898.1 DUF4946 domain-containing protein [Pseudomonas sp. FW305-122]PMU43904.1 DUF4946 domain-containing protein [Pseudomonas sp. FW305-47B]PMX63015.1 DUF4946 domain-containing protein [Pseudomonas sp. FW305-33]PMX69643.1 DUF4946 domain-containing protein [Pseudomonas sp. FW305-60]
MMRICKSMFVLICVLAGINSAHAGEPIMTWPNGWEVEAVPQADAKTQVSRQRAVKNDQDGTPVMVMELTMSQVESGHHVNLQGVLLEMRKSVQKDFFQGGYQSVCNKIHPTTLSRLSALETTCTITQNGRHVLSQTLVAAVDGDKAYVLSYAGQAEVYKASQDEIEAARNSLKL